MISINGFSQSWNPKSAYWIYGAGYMSSSADIRLSYLRDTLIKGQNCQIIKKDVIHYDYINKKYSYNVWDNEVTYFNSGVTYILNNDKFDTLYFFSAKKNDKYKITSKLSWHSGDSAYAVVVDTGQILINSFKLKWLAIDYNFKLGSSNYKLRDTIIEKIGATKYYYLPWDFINGMVDGNQGGSLKCFHDSLIGIYNNYNSGDCNFDISLGIPIIESILVNIFPIPADKKISITLKNKQVDNSILIYSASGQIIESIKSNFDKNEIIINTSSWRDGIYLLVIKNKFGLQKEKIIITHPNTRS